ncbi:hypothetical protein RN001_002788 [Aquatica leii]|uniref:MADF domain-containing protein n=1 Tax=Aquatica leii TaxID=1421715 RepID=A0AAN7SKD1_9COLE|nr:hypothetical protein RN001_002788 [Aquatica leii]
MCDLEEKIIRMVSHHKELYDQAAYTNIKLKKQIWQEIAKQVDASADVCKKKWRNIRDSYRKYVKEVKAKTEQEIRKTKRYKYADLLEFLNPYMHEKIVISSFYTDVENDFKEDSVNENQNENDRSTEDMDEYSTELDLEEDESRNEEVQNLKKRQAVILNEPGANMLLTYIPDEEKLKKRRKGNDEDDALKQLFLSMYGTVKTFPPTLQTETKIKLFNIITNAELEYLKCKERSSSDLSNSSNLSVPPSCTSSLLTSSTPLLTQCKIENIL